MFNIFFSNGGLSSSANAGVLVLFGDWLHETIIMTQPIKKYKILFCFILSTLIHLYYHASD